MLSSLVNIFSLSWVTSWWNVHNDAIFCSQDQVRLKIFVVLYDVLRGNTKFKPVLRKNNNMNQKKLQQFVTATVRIPYTQMHVEAR